MQVRIPHTHVTSTLLSASPDPPQPSSTVCVCAQVRHLEDIANAYLNVLAEGGIQLSLQSERDDDDAAAGSSSSSSVNATSTDRIIKSVLVRR